jgi:hypothetical protein
MEKTIEIGRTFVLPAQSADIPGRVAEQLWPPANMPLWIFVQFPNLTHVELHVQEHLEQVMDDNP